MSPYLTSPPGPRASPPCPTPCWDCPSWCPSHLWPGSEPCSKGERGERGEWGEGRKGRMRGGERGERGEGTMYKYMKNARGWTQELVIHANDGAWPPDPNGYVHLPLHLGIYSVHPSMSGPASASQQLTVWFCDHGPLLLNGVECLGCCLQIWNQGGDISSTPSLQVAMQ